MITLSLSQLVFDNITTILIICGAFAVCAAAIYAVFYKKINRLVVKHREIILYVLFGGGTTVVNFAVFLPLNLLFGEKLLLLTNFIAWVAAVAFAYITNRVFVFKSKEKRARGVLFEIGSFVLARVFSLALEEVILLVFSVLLSFDELAVKLVAAVLVVVLNYFFSKFVIFKKR